jgi:hypothetical protein
VGRFGVRQLEPAGGRLAKPFRFAIGFGFGLAERLRTWPGDFAGRISSRLSNLPGRSADGGLLGDRERIDAVERAVADR